MNMHQEPIRLPALVWAFIATVGPPLAAWLNGAEWKTAIATGILGLVAGGGVIARAESVRARVDSPATVEEQMARGHAELDTLAADGTIVER